MPDSIKITRRQLLLLEQGLMQLDAVRENDKEFVPILFDSKVSYRLMRTHEAVAKEMALFNKLDRAAAKTAGFFEGMTQTDENAKKADEYQRARAELLDEEIDLEGIFFVSVTDLLNRPEEFKKSRRNPVPQSVLCRLAPVLAEGGEV